MAEKHRRTAIGRFIHTSWSNMNTRCGKYKHLRTVDKCRYYENISIEFTSKEYKNFCIEGQNTILNLR
jgi:hypothetical protein